ncbi:hypothetical protein [uncultured Flavobacterium sp.]|uniref:hypothetical protein n=1 Tax=uncultured Flavobacterium sp. TaxID=165435 RepID=UPI0025D1396B|nr:hypothetical protein [uncultured Flavobacterium sp.]
MPAKYSLLLCTLMALYGYSPCLAQNFNIPVAKATGDLNKDGIEDLVTVMQDTLHENASYMIQVFFGIEGGYKPVVSSDELIEPQYPDGRDGFQYGNGFDSVEIKRGILLVNTSLLRGFITQKFRYQNGNFELIGYTSSSSDGIGRIYSEDFNLSTGDRLITVELYETGRMERTEKTKKVIRPLPRLQDMNASGPYW